MFRELLARIARSLNEHEVSYMVIGGQAVLLYGEPRITKDIDITLGVDASHLDTVLEVAGDAGLRILPACPPEFVKKTNVLPASDDKSDIRVDFIFSFSEYEKQALSRVNRVKIDDTEVNFASLEDLIIHKIVAGRPRDLEDVRVLVTKNKDFDRTYVLKWLKDFDTALSGNFSRTFRKLVRQTRG